MSEEIVDSLCATLPGAERTHRAEGELDGWKVGGKLFAFYGRRRNGVSVKTRDVETARMLIDAGPAIRAPYFHASWVRLEWPAEAEEVRHRVLTFYDLIRASLPRKQRAALPDRP